MSEKTRYKKSVNISISDGVKVQSGELSGLYYNSHLD